MTAATPAAGIRWLDRLAHDLRGPLAPLQTATYLLRSGRVEAAQHEELLAVIDRQTRRLARMLDELGDWSRASQGRLLGTVEPCEPAMLLGDACTTSGGGRVFPAVPADVDGTLALGDPQRLNQLFNAMVAHAAAHSRQAQPRVSMALAGEALEVRVDGLTQPEAAVSPALLLDEPQAEPDDEGLGLRLVIAKAIAEAHGGSLAWEVASGEGCLRCILPLRGPTARYPGA